MLRKHSREASWAITQANNTILEELREAKVRRLSEDELNKLMVTENLNWPRMDLVFNLDSPSTKVCLIHNYTSRISSAQTTLSLEILSAESGLGNLAEAAFSFRIFTFKRSYDIGKCYQQIHSVGRFVWVSLNIWFENVERFEKRLS